MIREAVSMAVDSFALTIFIVAVLLWAGAASF